MKYRLRTATQADADHLAALHAQSWKDSYRNMCPDAYLDEKVDADRQRVWRERMLNPAEGQLVLIADGDGDVMVGFICMYLDHDSHKGNYIDNLHVKTDEQGSGLGRRLMSAAARHAREQAVSTRLYLHVLEANAPAIRFYERLGGQLLSKNIEDLPWGEKGVVHDYGWDVDQL